MQILDAHNDLLMNLRTKEDINNYLKKYCFPNKVVKIFTAYYVSPKQESTQNSNNILDDIEEKFALISTFQSFICSMENIGFIKNEKDLYRLIKLKPICVTLTWNYDNCLAGGAYGTGGLTEFGRKAVKILEENNIIVDTAHLNKKSFLDICDITTKPLFCSHTSSKAIYNIPRGLDCEQLKLINDSKGFVGLCLYSTLLADKQIEISDIVLHYDSLFRNCNFKYIGLGTDFNATGECNPKGFDIDYQGVPILLDRIKSLYGEKHAEYFAGESLKQYFSNLNIKI